MGRVLIIGGTGFLGLNLASQMMVRRNDVMLVGARKLPDILDASLRRIAIFPYRLSDQTAINDLVVATHPDLVVHMASALKPGSSEEQFLVEQREVLEPTVRLIDLLARKQVPLVFISSGGAIYGRTDKDRLNEDDPCVPISFYGQSKLEIERHILSSHAAAALPYLIVRPSNPYGPFQPLDGGQGLISTIFGRLRSGQPLEIWGDGTAVRDYIHIDDFVNAMCDLLERRVWNSTINIGSGVGRTALDIIEAIERIMGRPVPVVFRPPRGVDVPKVVLDITRLASLGAFHDRPLDAGIRSYASQLGMV